MSRSSYQQPVDLPGGSFGPLLAEVHSVFEAISEPVVWIATKLPSEEMAEGMDLDNPIVLEGEQRKGVGAWQCGAGQRRGRDEPENGADEDEH